MQTKPSDEFKKAAIKAVLSIALFVVAYLSLIALSAGITYLAVKGGILLIAAKPMLITIALGIGMIGTGVLTFTFMLKFIFISNRMDHSHLVELSREDQPELFRFIEEIAVEVNTSLPKKIYLSAAINASVFYNSNFWSLFLPVRKNLEIGMGLVHSLSKSEFKATVAHEFGHFSQRSMRVGTYVYHVNRVIHNMLTQKYSIEQTVDRWANTSSYFTFFAVLSFKFIQGGQWILQKIYNVVNLSYMRLSREMEFHADQTAALVAGPGPVASSLIRLDWSNHCFNLVLGYYQGKIQDAVSTKNIYPQYLKVMLFLSDRHNLPLVNGLPQISQEHIGKYNKSKLVIADQWASHPTTKDRVKFVEQIAVTDKAQDDLPAISVFNDVSKLESTVSLILFSNVEYPGVVRYADEEEFISEFTTDYLDRSLHAVYNDYYDSRDPLPDFPSTADDVSSADDLFGQESLEMMYSFLSLQQDMANIRQIAGGNTGIKSFDYDGKKYMASDTKELISRLEKELAALTASIEANEAKINAYCWGQAGKHRKEEEFALKRQQFSSLEKICQESFAVGLEMIEASRFIHITTPFEEIEAKLSGLKKIEQKFKEKIRPMLEDPAYKFNPEQTQLFTQYIETERDYFVHPTYIENELEVLFSCLNNFQDVLSKTLFQSKKEFLDYQAELLVAQEVNPLPVPA